MKLRQDIKTVGPPVMKSAARDVRFGVSAAVRRGELVAGGYLFRSSSVERASSPAAALFRSLNLNTSRWYCSAWRATRSQSLCTLCSISSRLNVAHIEGTM